MGVGWIPTPTLVFNRPSNGVSKEGTVWFILSQAQDVSALAGNAGWAGAGLLGLVLAWLLLWHLPSKDKQIKDLIDGKDAIIKSLAAEHTVALDKSRQDFKEWLQLISVNHNTNVKALTDAISRDMVALQAALQALNTTIRDHAK